MFFFTQQNRNSHYQVPQASLKKPVPPPKPGHLKVTRAISNVEMGPAKPPPEKPRKYSDAGFHGRVPPPSVPPPVNYLHSVNTCCSMKRNTVEP